MLPTLSQRLTIAAAIGLGLLPLLWVAGPLTPATGMDGICLATARVGPVSGGVMLLLASLPVAMAGVLAAATGDRLSGVFAAGIAMAVLAGVGGSADGFFERQIAGDPHWLPGALWWLILESTLLAMAMLVYLGLTDLLAPRIAAKLPAWWPRSGPGSLMDEQAARRSAEKPQQKPSAGQTVDPVLGPFAFWLNRLWPAIGGKSTTGAAASQPNALDPQAHDQASPGDDEPASGQALADHASAQPPPASDLAAFLGKAALSLLMAAAIGALIGHLLIRSSDATQVLVSVFVAFVAAGVVTRMIWPEAPALGVLLSPMAVSIGAAFWLLTKDWTGPMIVVAWHHHSGVLPSVPRLPGVLLALPIHYASAGVAGAVLGLGWARTMSQPAASTATDSGAVAAQVSN